MPFTDLQADPYRVTLAVPADEASGESAVSVTFMHVPALNVLTALPADLPSARLLDCLHPNDEGITWPHDVNTPSHDPTIDLHIALLPGKPYKCVSLRVNFQE